MINEDYRIGHGYDVHRLETGEKFVIGGIEIDHEKGAVGHSDADVVIHVICDSILGALGDGDIGKHFPDTEKKYKGVDSKELLAEVMKTLEEKDFEINNVDVTVLLERPKLRDHVDGMIEILSDVMKIRKDKLSIKATTTEGLGFVGRQEGVAAHCVTLIKKI
ncbi:MAG: 2-C-methyl-D-erythritol 2,4-cyclodiphosphate synthase [Cytophagales bacterium]|tara:strand:- start:1038 stop:1526 length:489 start_codon:yes stop_codon:yes gene_type:complete